MVKVQKQILKGEIKNDIIIELEKKIKTEKELIYNLQLSKEYVEKKIQELEQNMLIIKEKSTPFSQNHLPTHILIQTIYGRLKKKLESLR